MVTTLFHCSQEQRFGGVLGRGKIGFRKEEQRDEDHDDYCNGIHDDQLLLSENDLFWEDEELVRLLIKEKDEAAYLGNKKLNSDRFLLKSRKECVEWMMKLISFYDFAPTTAVLALNYYDRFVSTSSFQRSRSRLAAVACLSIAMKVEEAKKFFIDEIQPEEDDSKFVFEVKAIKRMELVVLSALQWKMNLVTPLSFIDHIVRRFRMMNRDFLEGCERLIFSIIPDARLVHYLPSVVATAAMMYVIEDFGSSRLVKHQSQLRDVLNVNMDKVNDCYKLITVIVAVKMSKHNQELKRKHQSIPRRPNRCRCCIF